jgi:tetratricopeptide (TPR) repeat protein
MTPARPEKRSRLIKTIAVRKNVPEFNRLLAQCYAYVKRHPDERLWVRIAMFEVSCKIRLGVWDTKQPNASKIISRCITKASRLNDDQLMAELYAQYAEISPIQPGYTLYALKAIELQKKIGMHRFISGAAQYYKVALGLYSNEDYRQSIAYGRKFLSFTNAEKKGNDPHLYIMTSDLVGASYLRLNQLDSAKYFYEKILDTLSKKNNHEPEFRQIWGAIAKGNIGRVLSLQQQDDAALPLITTYLQTSLQLRSYNNVAMAQNVLGSMATGNAFTGALARVAGENIGTYGINQGSLVLNNNYMLTFASAD